MASAIQQFYERIGVDALLDRYKGLRIRPSASDDLRFVGALAFQATGPSGVVHDEYEIDLRIPTEFPARLPRVWETRGRIPANYHKLIGNSLCLGAPTEIRLRLSESPRLLTLVDGFVIPYLYGYSVFEKTGKMPFGQLPHGDEGVREYLADMFGANQGKHPEEFLRLAAKKKRDANKMLCPCDSGRRLGRCHNRSTNQQRKRMGRHWFRWEYARVIKALDEASPSQKKAAKRMANGRA